MNSEQFKEAFRILASGVSVISFWAGADLHGFAATSLTSVSMSPPMALFCVGRQSRSFGYLNIAKEIGISILGSHQREISERFSGGSPQGSFRDIEILQEKSGAPVIRGAMATFEARIVEQHPVGDNVICVCSLLSARAETETSPLIYMSRQYHKIGAPVEEADACIIR
jgi:flavin reductase (DIM6/NTAB) family NADH-FMN oxidoreductase RutF